MQRRISYLLPVITGLLVHPAWAIINIESSRPLEVEEGVSGGFEVKGNGSFGNTEKLSLAVNSSTLWKRPQGANFLILSYVYGESFEVKDQNQAFFHLRHVQHWAPRWAWEVFTQLQSDEFKRLNWRFLAGGGLRREWWSSDSASFYTGFGAFYSQEDLAEQGELTAETEETGRGNFYMAVQQGLGTAIEYVGALYFQPRYDEFHDYHLLWDNTFESQVNEALSLLFELQVAHDNQPPAGVEPTDTKTMLGIRLKY